MSRRHQDFLLRLALSAAMLLSAPAARAAPDAATPPPKPAPAGPATEITTTRYLVGGLVGTPLGFGIGHAIQRRFKEEGILFMSAEIAFLVAAFFAAPCTYCTQTDAEKARARRTANVLFGGFVVTRLWEAGDLWLGPKHLRKRAMWKIAPQVATDGARLAAHLVLTRSVD